MLVGVTGKAGAGKDEFAKWFMANGWKRYRFADPIKDMITRGFDLNPDVWDDREAKEADIPWLGRSPRYLAQTLGTEWGRHMVHPDLWLLLAEQVMIQNPKLIIPDVRFDNEAAWILQNGGILVAVTGGPAAAQNTDNAGHASEQGVSRHYVGHFVANTGTIEDLHGHAARIAKLHGN